MEGTDTIHKQIDLSECGCSVHYVHKKGRTELPSLVFLHANPGDSRDFEGIWDQLNDGREMFALDWPGYGRSSPPVPIERAQQGALYFDKVLREFLDEIKISVAIFIGNSVGGFAAARLAIEAPERVLGLVLVSPGGFTRHTLFSRFFCGIQSSRLFSLPPDWFARLYISRWTSTTRAMLERARDEQSKPQAKAISRYVWKSFLSPEHNLCLADSEDPAIFHQPCMLIFNDKDPIINAKSDGRNAAAAIPHAQFVTLPLGHAPFAEDPVLFLEHMKPFLDSLNRHEA